MIRKEYGSDPRLHCYLNCCSISCPRLSRRWLNLEDPNAADALLDESSASFVGPQGGVSVVEGGARLRVSSIFKWYRSDFQNAGGAAAFARTHAAKVGVSDDAALEYQPYDWRPNSAELARELGLI